MERIKIAELDDRQLDELLVYAPEFSVQNSENIKKAFLQKASAPSVLPVRRNLARRVLLAATVTVLALTASITALAATGVIDFAGFYNRVYNSIFSNPEASPYTISGVAQVGAHSGAEHTLGIVITGEGIDVPGSGGTLTVEPVAAFISQGDWERYFFDLYIRLKLTSVDKLHIPNSPDELYIHQKYTNEYGTHDTLLNSYGFGEITYIDDYSAFVSFRTHAFADNITFDKNAGTIAFYINAFSSEHDLYTYPEFGDDGGNLILREEEYPIVDGVTYYGYWEVVIDTNSAPAVETLYVDGSFDGVDAAVRLSATGVNVSIEGNTQTDSYDWHNPRWDSEGSFRITLSDGRVIESLYVENSSGIGGDGDASVEYWSVVEFYNPAEVVKVELFGETVFDLMGG